MSDEHAFLAELQHVLFAFAAKFGNAHGDRVVLTALCNPLLKLGTPLQVWATVCKAGYRPGDLWIEFKGCGGVSKELPGGVDEAAQHDALRATWDAMRSRTGA